MNTHGFQALRAALRRLRRGDDGMSLIETALVMPVLILLIAGSIDLGRVCYYGIEISNAAAAGATYGAQAPEDAGGIINATLAGAPDIPNMNVSVGSGCECSDGTSPVPNCSSTPSCTENVVHYVEVDTSSTTYPVILFSSLPSTFPLAGTARLRTAY